MNPVNKEIKLIIFEKGNKVKVDSFLHAELTEVYEVIRVEEAHICNVPFACETCCIDVSSEKKEEEKRAGLDNFQAMRKRQENCSLRKGPSHPQFVTIKTPKGEESFSGSWLTIA
jgi:hypothetical protein